jgi:hypothetical protein
MAKVEKILEAAIDAAKHVVQEEPYVGGFNFTEVPALVGDGLGAHERALSGRLGVWLGRQPVIRELEEQRVFVDLEYDQMGQGEQKQVKGKHRRIDLLVHERGINGQNLLVCEVKVGHELPQEVDLNDLEKLVHMTLKPFEYKAGLWIHFPRSPRGDLHCATVVKGVCTERKWYRARAGNIEQGRW